MRQQHLFCFKWRARCDALSGENKRSNVVLKTLLREDELAEGVESESWVLPVQA
jgi:hypothetical protein